MGDSTMTHEVLRRFEQIEERLDALEEEKPAASSSSKSRTTRKKESTEEESPE